MKPPAPDTCAVDPKTASPPKRFYILFLMAAVTGAMAGTLGGLFHLTTESLDSWRKGLIVSLGEWGWAASMLMTTVLVLLAFLAVRRFAPETAGSGIPEIEGALAGFRPLRWRRVLSVKLPAGILALGSGLVLGREGPTIHMGGALGRAVAGMLRMPPPYIRHCLVAAGAGAGLTAAFNAPLAGILFVVEEMRDEFAFDFVSFHCVVIACACSTVACQLIAGSSPAIPMPILPAPEFKELVMFLAFGATVGLMGVFFNAALIRTLNLYDTLPSSFRITATCAIGALIGLFAWGYPSATGAGHDTLLDAMISYPALVPLMTVLVLRFLFTMLSYASGVPGGLFAPMLALGTLWGVFAGQMTAQFIPAWTPQPDCFAVTGMGALFAATVRAPMTGMVLILEMTGNYSLTLPLMFTCFSAAATAEAFGAKPIYRTLMTRALMKGEQAQ